MDLKKLSWLGMLFFIIGLSFSQVVMADGFPDIKNHWAEESIEVWLARGYVNGYPDGHFRPDDFITQAEFCALFNRVFGFKVGADYPGKDVPEGKWYTAEMKRAIAAGYLSSDGKLDPQGIITRKQVAISLGRVLSLSAVPRDHYSQFKDLGEIDLATAMAINTVLDKKYMGGQLGNCFYPEQGITRAELLAVLDRVAGKLYDRPGVYGTPYDKLVIEGNVLINTRNVTLRNVAINGDLNIAPGIGDGSVTLINVTVRGETKFGGGAIINDCTLGQVVVTSPYKHKIRLLAQGTTVIGLTKVRVPVILEEANLVGQGFSEVTFNVARGSELDLRGNFKRIVLEGVDVKLNLGCGKIDYLSLPLAAQGVRVDLAEAVDLKKVEVVCRATFTGWGNINQAFVYARGVNFELFPEKVTVAPGITALVCGRVVSGTYTGEVRRDVWPYFKSNYPQIWQVGSSGFTLSCKTNTACQAYYVVCEAGDDSPLASQIIKGLDAFGRRLPVEYRGVINLEANQEKSVRIGSLESDLCYNVFIVLKKQGVNMEPVVYKQKVTTRRK